MKSIGKIRREGMKSIGKTGLSARGFVFVLVFALGGFGARAYGAVHALFDLDTPKGGPFPSDRFTVEDRSHITGLRVNLPFPDCEARVSDCQDIEVINTLDGFNLQPRLSIPLDGPIDVETVTSETVFLVSLGSTTSRGDRGGKVIGINQVVWDTFTDTLHVESDELLDQHTRYALIVTRGVRDESGAPVEATEAFRRFRHTVQGEYKQALLDAIHAARRLGVREENIAVASVFTTQSVTAILEKIRDQIKGETPEPADFLLGPKRERTVFTLDEIAGNIIWRQHTRVDPPGFNSVNVNLSLLRVIYPGAVGKLAFGKYSSPDYEVHPGEYFPAVGTRSGTPEIQGTNEIYFNLALPSGPMPKGGWPVAIVGLGNTISKQDMVSYAAAQAAQGIATVYINAVGHGFGALGTLTVNRTAGEPITFTAGGRGIDQDENNMIGANEGLNTPRPRSAIFFRDGTRQTAVDLMQLVRVIEVGVDVDGDGERDLDASRIYYFGHSLGGNYGTVFLAVEPSVRAGVFAAPGHVLANQLLGDGRGVLGAQLASRQPPLVNAPGITVFGGNDVNPPHYHENRPLRDGIPVTVVLEDKTTQVIQSPVTNTVTGAMSIQEVVENIEWVAHAGIPAAYAPHLRRAPLPGVPAKSVIYQFAKGDLSAPNPNTTAIVRAGELADRTVYYRHDLARAEIPTLPQNPHGFMRRIDLGDWQEIVRGAQEQIAVFLASDGKEIIHPEPARFFEVPIVLPLPEGLNYIR